jgi:RimJ/RimL family protein N-acetyltransferase
MILRPVAPFDRADLVALESDPQVMLYLNGGLPVPEECIPDGDFLTPRGHEPQVLAAIERASGDFIGWFAFFDDGLQDGLRRAEVGYRLNRAAWGRGFASEGVAALIALAFDHWGFDCLRAQTMATNLGSRRVMEKTGMAHVATVFPTFEGPIPGAELGEVIYEIRRAGV